MRINKVKIPGIALVLIIGAAALSCNRSANSADKAKSALVVKTSSVSVREVVQTAQLFGRVSGANETQVYSEFPGKILRYTVKEGQRVSKGQTVALIDRSLPGVNYQPYPVRAPASGVVAFRYLKNGSMVDKRAPLLLISSTGKLEVNLDVPAKFLARIKPGAKGWIILDSVQVPGVISSVSAAVDPRTGAGVAKLLVNNHQGLLVSGQVVRAKVVVQSVDGALAVPVESVLRRDGQSVVFVIKNRVAHQVPVQVVLEGDEFAQVKGQLAEGDSVAITGVLGLADGVRVEVATK